MISYPSLNMPPTESHLKTVIVMKYTVIQISERTWQTEGKHGAVSVCIQLETETWRTTRANKSQKTCWVYKTQ